MSYILSLASNVKEAKNDIAYASTIVKNNLLYKIADALEKHIPEILRANECDLAQSAQNCVPSTMVDRLALSDERIIAIANSVRKVAALPDPVGEIMGGDTLPNGLVITKKRIPIGVIGIIYEARPNVTVDAAVLCLKSGNAVMLRGGKEAINTNITLVKIMQSAIGEQGLNSDIVSLVEDTSRETAREMMKLNGFIDVLIPRGGAGLIKSVVDNATVPVIETGSGNCHIYVDESADLAMAEEIVYNAKVSRPSVCNACESLLVHKNVAKTFLPKMKARFDTKNVIMLGCKTSCDILNSTIPRATDDDFATEFLGYVISVKVVNDIDEAISHIARFSTGHSETIVTQNVDSARKFTETVDSAAVYVNASTRFTDGEEFGFGAEIGISTQKLHARGPMGLKELTSYKYIINGNGQIR